jgi:macrolide transport system ATP-binding/permease protein
MTSAGGPLLVLERVERSFGTSGPPALAGVDLVIHRGEFLCILGASGSGKSTLLNILGCLDRPSGGRVLINGEDVWSQSPDRIDALRRQSFGFIFQRYALIASLDVAQNVELPGLYARLSADERAGRVRTLLARFGLADKARQRPNLLSGGEQQRVAIARALFNRPAIILADEPTGALDSANSGKVMAALIELNREGHTVVVVTHDPAVARMAPRVVTMRDGRVVADQQSGDAPQPRAAAPGSEPARQAAGRFGGPFALLRSAVGMGLQSLARNRLQSSLTLLGIAIGIGAVFAMLTVGQAGNRQVVRNIESLGAGIITTSRGPPGVRGAERTVVSLVRADVDVIRRVPGVRQVAPEMDGVVLARVEDRDFIVTATGTNEEFPIVRDWAIAEGVFFSADHVARHAPVVVLGATARANLFPGGAEAIGRHLLIQRQPFLVIGVMERKGVTTGPGHDRDNQVWLPDTTAGSRVFGRRHLDRIVAKADPGVPAETVRSQIRKAVLERHRIEDFSVVALAEIIRTAERTQRTLNWLLAVIAGLALTIAGVGVMNMMLSSVTERIAEIGTRMAVGASRVDIRIQFLAETLVLCGLGGAIGALTGLAAALAAASALKLEMAWSPTPFLVAMGAAALSGLLAGLLPAMRASTIQPSLAIRHE